MKHVVRRIRTAVLTLGSILALVSSAPVFAATSWDFMGVSDAPVSQVGNSLIFTVDGQNVTATSWADTGIGGTLESATISRHWTGLGSCNSAEEGDCTVFTSSESTHQVDNQGEQDWVLLVFEEAVNFDLITYTPYGEADRDASYWIGNINSGQDLTGLSYSDLLNIGFGDRVDVDQSVGDGRVSINFNGISGNALLIGAQLGGVDDRMKISTLQTSVVPLPASAWLMLSGLAVLAWMRRRQITHSPPNNAELKFA